MSILRNSAITALVAGAALATPMAASASTAHAAAPAAHTATSASASVHPVRHCTRQTFNDYHGHTLSPTCYAGTGSKQTNIYYTYQVTTGKYWGCMLTRTGRASLFRSFGPHQTINFRPNVDLESITLATRPVFCPLGK